MTMFYHVADRLKRGELCDNHRVTPCQNPISVIKLNQYQLSKQVQYLCLL